MRSPKHRREVLAALSIGGTGAGCLERDPQDATNATDGRPADTDADRTGGDDGSTGTDDESSGSTADRTAADGPVRVVAGPDGDFVFEPESLRVSPGTTVVWEWDSDDHNVAPEATPEGVTWTGYPEVVDRPNTYEHTFEESGTYEYVCEPHAAAGMEGTIVVDGGN